MKRLAYALYVISLFFFGSVVFAADASNIVLPVAVSLNKVTRLYYATFASSTFNPSVSGTTGQSCPRASIYINAPVVQVPAFPGLPSGPTGVFMWQCTVPLHFWMALGSSAVEFDSVDVDPSLTNILSAFSTADWETYTSLPNTLYTLYQFPNNAYVPVGVGGSGLGCGNAGGGASVVCKAGGSTISATIVNQGGKWLYYTQPAQNMDCTLHRDYGNGKTSCTGSGCPCDGTYTVQGGQVLVGACCSGTWKISKTNFSDPAYNTCGGGC